MSAGQRFILDAPDGQPITLGELREALKVGGPLNGFPDSAELDSWKPTGSDRIREFRVIVPKSEPEPPKPPSQTVKAKTR